MYVNLPMSSVIIGPHSNQIPKIIVNMKFTIDWCVFDFPENNLTAANTQCAEICGGPDNSAKSALTDRLLQTNATIQYQYCEDGNGAFSKIAQACMDCLDKVPNSKTLKNCTLLSQAFKIKALNSILV